MNTRRIGKVELSRRQPAPKRHPLLTMGEVSFHEALFAEGERQRAARASVKGVRLQFDQAAHAALDAEWQAERKRADDLAYARELLTPRRSPTVEERLSAIIDPTLGEAPVSVETWARTIVDALRVSRARAVAGDESIGVVPPRAVIGAEAVARAIECAERRGYQRGRADEVAARMADEDAPTDR